MRQNINIKKHILKKQNFILVWEYWEFLCKVSFPFKVALLWVSGYRDRELNRAGTEYGTFDILQSKKIPIASVRLWNRDQFTTILQSGDHSQQIHQLISSFFVTISTEALGLRKANKLSSNFYFSVLLSLAREDDFSSPVFLNP